MRLNSIKSKSRLRILLIAGVVIAVLAVVGSVAWNLIRTPAETPEIRGEILARDLGCMACHGPGGLGGNPNPGSDDGEIPAWDGGMAMMYIENTDEIREWILDGHPKRLREQTDGLHDHGDHEAEHHPSLPVEMPPYRDLVTDKNVDDLAAYFLAVSAYVLPEDPAPRQGYHTASKLGCFGCHGPMGLLGSSNPGSFSGRISPWTGPDFEDLVHDETELREWILTGQLKRISDHPIGARFLTGQQIQMPGYRDELNDEELNNIVEYIRWLNKR